MLVYSCIKEMNVLVARGSYFRRRMPGTCTPENLVSLLTLPIWLFVLVHLKMSYIYQH